MADQIYKVRDPSGSIREIKGPEGATDEQVIAQAKMLFASPAPVQQPEQLQNTRIGGLSKTPFSAPDFGNIGYNLGGQVTDIASSAGLSPETSAALGYGSNVATQAIAPIAIGSAAGQLMKPAMEGTGKFLMRSALNAPLKERLSGNADRAVGTMLNEGYNPTMGGADKMREAATGLGKQVTDITNKSPYAIDPNSLYPAIREKLQTAGKQVNPVSDSNIIRNSWDEFINSVGNPLSVKEAQALKEGTYRSLGDKAYGIKSAEETAKETAQKALARALKEKIAALEPQTAPLLKQQSDLLNAAKLAERRGGTDQGLKVAGIAPIAPTMGRMLAMLLDKYTLLKSLTARGIYSGAERIPQAVGGTTAALIQGLRSKPDQGDQP